jgi:hypothetical protein
MVAIPLSTEGIVTMYIVSKRGHGQVKGFDFVGTLFPLIIKLIKMVIYIVGSKDLLKKEVVH